MTDRDVAGAEAIVNELTPSEFATAENAVKQMQVTIKKAFDSFLKLPNLENREALVKALLVPELGAVMGDYRKAFAAKHFD